MTEVAPLYFPTEKEIPVLQTILEDVEKEVIRSVSLHGDLHSEHEAASVLREEFEEFWDLVKKNPKKMNSLEKTLHFREMRKELIQVAAMAVKAVECLRLDERAITDSRSDFHHVRPLEHAPVHLGDAGATHKRHD